MPIVNDGITHAGWVHAMGEILDRINALIYGTQEMQAALAEMGAGADQMKRVNGWVTLFGDLDTVGVRFIEGTTAHYKRQGEEQAAAGGKSEVARDKQYNTF